MKSGYTHISIVLDRSGSMEEVAKDTIGGFNAFLKSQKECPGKATISMVQFDTEYEELYNFKDVKEVINLTGKTFIPRGCTALHDAIGKCINTTGEKLSNMKEKDRPEKVIFVIITDGLENASKEFHAPQIKEMIKKQSENYSWTFTYIGANQDSILISASIGIMASNTLNYTANNIGTKNLYSSLSSNTTSYRCATVAESKDMNFFNEEDRKKQQEALGK